MGVMKYPGAPDFTYADQVLVNLQAIIAIQQRMGQGFWFERQGGDERIIGHDAVWIDPSMPIYIEFDSIDQLVAQKEVVDEWTMFLTVEGSDRLVFRPPNDALELIKDEIARQDAADIAPNKRDVD